MKKLCSKNIFNIIVLILLIDSFLNLVPIKYNKTAKEYNGYYYSMESEKFEGKDSVKVKLVLKSYTNLNLFKLYKSTKFKAQLFVNNTEYNIKTLNFVNNKYIGTFQNNKSNNDFSIIFISEDLKKVLICNYDKSQDIWCGNKNLNDIKNFKESFLNK